jgi:hypothetical protein
VDRELLLAALFALVALPSTWIGGAFARPSPPQRSAAATERAHWASLCAPAVPPMLATAALLGWAIVEPEEAEALHGVLLLALLLPLLVVARAAVRAARAAVRSRPSGVASTFGLLFPRVHVDEDFAARLGAAERHAVEAHERAHAQAYDPLRIWVAQIVTDLQWPLPNAARRYRTWRRSLELARDEDALRAGADPTALAHAIIAGAKAARRDGLAALASLDGDDELRARIARLLEARSQGAEVPRRRRAPVFVLVAALLASFTVGVVAGEGLVAPFVLEPR